MLLTGQDNMLLQVMNSVRQNISKNNTDSAVLYTWHDACEYVQPVKADFLLTQSSFHANTEWKQYMYDQHKCVEHIYILMYFYNTHLTGVSETKN